MSVIDEIKQKLAHFVVNDTIKTFSHFKQAYQDFSEYNEKSTKDVLLVFGSFHTVSDALMFFEDDMH